MALKAADYDAIRELRDAATSAWQSARLLRATSNADLTRSDMAMQRLYTAVQAVERLDLTPPKPTRKAARK